MIVDKILDRKDGIPYTPERFSHDVKTYGIIGGHRIVAAMKGGNEKEVKTALHAYIKDHGYPRAISDYIESVQWLTA